MGQYIKVLVELRLLSYRSHLKHEIRYHKEIIVNALLNHNSLILVLLVNKHDRLAFDIDGLGF